ncbi:MAG: hypothetical protein AAGN35_10565 [Bacteroidota bacterium]
MRKVTQSICLLALFLGVALTGCDTGPEHPSEEEVRAKVVGEFCSGDFRSRLELTAEGRYLSRRNKPNPFGNGLLPEKCEGNYTLTYNDERNVWTVEFAKSDESSNPLVKCAAAALEIWQAESGYSFGEGPVKFKDPFSESELQSNKCGDL